MFLPEGCFTHSKHLENPDFVSQNNNGTSHALGWDECSVEPVQTPDFVPYSNYAHIMVI